MSANLPSEVSEDNHIGIGALARASGVPVETLRTWERRYGVPEPIRTASGHRLYPVSAIEHVRLISAAIDAGHRAAQATRFSVLALRELVQSPAPEISAELFTPPAPRTARDAGPPVDVTGSLLDRVIHLDADGLSAALERELKQRGLLAFLDEVLAPLLNEVGEAWSRGAITEVHEHVASERIRDVLGAVSTAYTPPPNAPTVLFAGLPGDHHAIGLYMAAAAATLAGVKIVQVGANTPITALVGATREVQVQAVVVSVSSAFDPGGARQILVDLRRALERGIMLVVGGAGAPEHVAGTSYPAGLTGLVQTLLALRNRDRSHA